MAVSLGDDREEESSLMNENALLLIRRWATIAAFIAALVTGIFIGRFSKSGFSGINASGEEPIQVKIDDQRGNFQDIVAPWNDYIVQHDGFLPIDFYKGLYDTGRLRSYLDLTRFGFVMKVPLRVNPDLKKNPKIPIFFENEQLTPLIWVYFADGTSASMKPSQWKVDPWESVLLKNGFRMEEWSLPEERSRWLSLNREALRWDPHQSIYVVNSRQ